MAKETRFSGSGGHRLRYVPNVMLSCRATMLNDHLDAGHPK